MRTILLLLIAFSAHCVLAQQTYEITWMMGISPEDASVTAAPGDTVRWVWGEEGMPHSVESSDPDAPADFGSEILIGMGSVYEYTFEEEVTFSYQCGVHPMMTGVITIEALSVEDIFIRNLKYYPNPVSDVLTITSLMPLDKYEILNPAGKVVKKDMLENVNVTTIDTGSLKSGLYFVAVTSDELTNVFKITVK